MQRGAEGRGKEPAGGSGNRSARREPVLAGIFTRVYSRSAKKWTESGGRRGRGEVEGRSEVEMLEFVVVVLYRCGRVGESEHVGVGVGGVVAQVKIWMGCGVLAVTGAAVAGVPGRGLPVFLKERESRYSCRIHSVILGDRVVTPILSSKVYGTQ